MTGQLSNSKSVQYDVLIPPDLSVAKSIQYDVLIPPDLSVAKSVQYVVLTVPLLTITGVHATGHVGTLSTITIDTVDITAVYATGHVAALATEAGNITVPHVSATGFAGTVITFSGPNTGSGSVTGVHATGHVAALATQHGPQITGVHATGHVGTLTIVTFEQGFGMSGLGLVTIPVVSTDTYVSVRFSYDKGATWSTPHIVSLGEIGQYQTILQVRRIGIGRSLVVEISTASPRLAAIGNLSLDAETESN